MKMEVMVVIVLFCLLKTTKFFNGIFGITNYMN